MNSEEQERIIHKIIAKAWMDDDYKAALLADPTARLKEEGLEIPPGVEIHIVEDTENVHNMVLPLKPTPDELTENAHVLFLQSCPRRIVACRC
jgi:hypothetical protein